MLPVKLTRQLRLISGISVTIWVYPERRTSGFGEAMQKETGN